MTQRVARSADANPYKRHQDGSRTYFVTNGSRHLKVDGGEQEALLVQADLRSKRARGLRVTPLPTTFRAVAETWFERGCARWLRRPRTATGRRLTCMCCRCLGICRSARSRPTRLRPLSPAVVPLVPTMTTSFRIIRDVPISPLLVAALRRHRMSSQFSQADHFVFCSKQGTPLDRGNVRKRGFDPAVELAGLNRLGEPKLTVHDLKHAFASVVAHHGFAAVDVALFMGHADSRVTEQVYLHPYDEAVTAERLRAVIGDPPIPAAASKGSPERGVPGTRPD